MKKTFIVIKVVLVVVPAYYWLYHFSSPEAVNDSKEVLDLMLGTLQSVLIKI